MNKLRLYLILSLCITVMLCSHNSLYAESIGSIMLIPEAAEPGKDLTVEVRLDDNPGIAYLDLTLTYDANQLTYGASEKPDANFDDWTMNVNTPGKIRAIWIDSNGHNNETTGVVLKMIFHAADNVSGKVNVSLQVNEAWDENDNRVFFSIGEYLDPSGSGTPVSFDVTFRVINGFWNDGSAQDKIVTLKGKQGKPLLLAEEQIPAVGNNPASGYKAGSWDSQPSPDEMITENTVFTYTYAEKIPVSYTVTFRVVNGFWNDGTNDEMNIILFGFADDGIYLSADEIPEAGSFPNAGYEKGAWDVTPNVDAVIMGDTTYTYTYKDRTAISYDVTFKVVNGYWDDGTSGEINTTVMGFEGDTLKLIDIQIPFVGNYPLDGYQTGSWDVEPDTETIISSDMTYTYTYTEAPATIPGDLDGNGKVNGADLILLKQFLVSMPVEFAGNPDVTGDGKVNGADLIRLKQYLVNMPVELH